jgi:hypothetical protein
MRRRKFYCTERDMSNTSRPSQRQVDHCVTPAIDAAQRVVQTYKPTEVDVPTMAAHAFLGQFPTGATVAQISQALVHRAGWRQTPSTEVAHG